MPGSHTVLEKGEMTTSKVLKGPTSTIIANDIRFFRFVDMCFRKQGSLGAFKKRDPKIP